MGGLHDKNNRRSCALRAEDRCFPAFRRDPPSPPPPPPQAQPRDHPPIRAIGCRSARKKGARGASLPRGPERASQHSHVSALAASAAAIPCGLPSSLGLSFRKPISPLSPFTARLQVSSIPLPAAQAALSKAAQQAPARPGRATLSGGNSLFVKQHQPQSL